MHTFFHSQNLTKDPGKKLRSIFWSGRCWLHLTGTKERRDLVFGAEWHFGPYSRFLGAKLGFNKGDAQICVSIQLPFLFHLYLSVTGLLPDNWMPGYWKASHRHPGKKFYYPVSREIGFSVHGGTAFFSLWENEMEHSRDDPWWQHFSFTPANFFLGRQRYTEADLSITPVVVKLPEGEYPAMVRLFVAAWKRQRWPWPTKWVRAEVELLRPIPIPGKGENAWDLGDDAIFSLTCTALTPDEAVCQLVESIMRTRREHGGRSWQPTPDPLLAPQPAANGGAA